MLDDVKVFVFSSSTEVIPSIVIDSIKLQGIYPEFIDCTFDESIPKRKRIAMAKEKCRKIGIASGFKYVVLNDSDLQHTRTDNFESMQKFLDEKKDFGAVSLLKKDIKNDLVYNDKIINHICSGVIMFSTKALEKVKFDIFEAGPTCFSIGKSLSENEMLYGYVDGVERIISIQRK